MHLDLFLNLIERHRFTGGLALRFDDVIAKLGLDDVAHGAILKAECRIFKGFNHLAGTEGTQITALLGAGASGLSLCNLREICPALDFRKEVIRLLPGCLLFLRGGLGVNPDQDMAGMDRLGFLEHIRVRVIKLLGLLGDDGDLGTDFLLEIGPDHDLTGHTIL